MKGRRVEGWKVRKSKKNKIEFFVSKVLSVIFAWHLSHDRESGYGRYDIMIIPKDLAKTGYVMEFKTVDTGENETVESAVKAALKQIEEKKYETELVQRGVKNYKKLAVVFKGKDVTVKEAAAR